MKGKYILALASTLALVLAGCNEKDRDTTSLGDKFYYINKIQVGNDITEYHYEEDFKYFYYSDGYDDFSYLLNDNYLPATYDVYSRALDMSQTVVYHYDDKGLCVQKDTYKGEINKDNLYESVFYQYFNGTIGNVHYYDKGGIETLFILYVYGQNVETEYIYQIEGGERILSCTNEIRQSTDFEDKLNTFSYYTKLEGFDDDFVFQYSETLDFDGNLIYYTNNDNYYKKYSYNENGDCLSLESGRINDADFVPVFVDEATYSDKGVIVERNTFSIENGVRTPSQKFVYNTDEIGLITSVVNKDYNESTKQFDEGSTISYSYVACDYEIPLFYDLELNAQIKGSYTIIL